ncbi:MAG: hypothetical protein ACREUQ_03095 [Burkholderiales bacterium]
MDLTEALPSLLPKAVAWAESQSAAALASGAPLRETDLALARAAGVRRADRVRVRVVDTIPAPQDAQLREAAAQTGLLGPDTIGLVLGYAVFLREGYETSPRVLSHELRHVYQYECYGSIKAFLSVYLPQIVQFGYADAPLELDAAAHEQ